MTLIRVSGMITVFVGLKMVWTRTEPSKKCDERTYALFVTMNTHDFGENVEESVTEHCRNTKSNEKVED